MDGIQRQKQTRQRGRKDEGAEGGKRRRNRGAGGWREREEGEKGEERPLHLFIMMPVVVSVSCVGSRLYFMF